MPVKLQEIEMKRGEVLSFDDGVLTVKMSGYGAGNGWATLAFNEKQFELDDDGYQIVEIPPSELYELRDFLNRILTERPGDLAAQADASGDLPQSARGPSEPLQCLRCGTIDAFGPVSKKDTHQWMKP